jgi:radical SAM superfamily enzyme YgiQ (UPF0313 family)
MARKLNRQKYEKRLDGEIDFQRKGWQNKIRVALVYPNHYPVGMSNLGFQTVYRLLNTMDYVECERVFLPDSGHSRTDVASLESASPLQAFHCVAFSLSFENDFINILDILQKAEFPLLSAKRGASLPLILAGGVSCFLNPEPIAPFIDCFLLGEAEAILAPFFEAFDPDCDRKKFLLEAARELPGVYVPAFFKPQYDGRGLLSRFSPIEDVPGEITRVYANDIGSFATDSIILTKDTSFEDAFIIEVSRGCPHGCRFCGGGYVYRPPRFRPIDRLKKSMKTGARQSGKIGLLGAAVSDLPDLKTLCRLGRELDCQLSFSSLRADALDADLISSLKGGRLKTATIAPETGSQRLRQVINKGLEEESILEAAESLVACGIINLKLYFMIGLPTETQEDVSAIASLVKKIKHRFLKSSRARGRMGTITVSLNTFVPKPFTPFQWTAMDELKSIKRKIKVVRQDLKGIANVRVHADVPRWAYVQALLSRGDRRIAELLSMTLDNNQNWPQTLKNTSVSADFFVLRERSRDELLPWDFIDNGLDKNFLWKEYQWALAGKAGPVCPMDPENCRLCGVCKS